MKWKSTFSFFCACPAFTALAQTAVLPSSSRAADDAWAALKNQAAQNASTAIVGNSSKTAAQTAATFVGQADQFRDFRNNYPDHPATNEAGQKEAVSLAFAALNGDTAQDSRRQTLIEQVRHDGSLSQAVRFQAVAWNQQVAITRQALPTRTATLAAHENLARQLIAEFPAVADGYNSLLGLARDSAPNQGTVIARDLLSMSAPPDVKQQAQVLLDRFSLIGKSLSSILTAAGASNLDATTKGKVTVVYSWSTSDALSQTLAKRIARQTPKAGFIGISLDTNLAAGKQAASTLPGVQYYDAKGRGLASPLAVTLKVSNSSAAYLVDAAGIIRDVQGTDDWADKLHQLGP